MPGTVAAARVEARRSSILANMVSADDVPVLQEPHQLQAEEGPDEGWLTDLEQDQEGARPDEPEVLRLPDEDPEVEPAQR